MKKISRIYAGYGVSQTPIVLTYERRFEQLQYYLVKYKGRRF
ncbi:protein of unknown function [[Clostridium] ultunense Esp]|uniref:Uncharacterized protein n=1 Tax=[Clostridium] ultunense Esp TaxID=1288971 RepID=A0A1M4PRL6_9FIRM|nr:protein of unknown function [[Clostridium] ultunense Esp]